MMKQGQSTLEYAVVIACLVAALLAMQIYLKRGMQGRFRQAADDLGQQYAPKNTTSDITIIQGSECEAVTTTAEDEKDKSKLKTTTTINTKNQTDKTYGNEEVGKFEATLFE